MKYYNDSEKLSKAMLNMVKMSGLTKKKEASLEIARNKFSLEKNVLELKQIMENKFK